MNSVPKDAEVIGHFRYQGEKFALVGGWRYLVLDSIDHWWIKYIRFQRLSNGQYFCFTNSADTIIPLYKDKLKAEFVNQNKNHRVHRT